MTFLIRAKIRGCHVACIATTSDGLHLFSTADTDTNPALFGERIPGKYKVTFRLPVHLLNVGTFHLAVGLGIPGIESLDRQEAVAFTIT